MFSNCIKTYYGSHNYNSNGSFISSSSISVEKDVLKFSPLFRYANKDYFGKFPDEVILHIFSFLPEISLGRMALICRRWRILSCDQSLWQRLDLFRRRLPNYVVHQLCGHGLKVLRLASAEIRNESPMFDSFANISVDDSSFNKSIMMTEYKLEYLDMTSLLYSSVFDIADLIGKCTLLKCLSLEGCSVNSAVLLAIAQNHNLQKLNMALCTNVTEEIVIVLESCLELVELNLAWCDLSQNVLERVCKTMPLHLQRLNISGYTGLESTGDTSLTDSDVNHLISRCRYLIELDVCDSRALSTDGLRRIILEFKFLKTLWCSRCYDTDGGVLL